MTRLPKEEYEGTRLELETCAYFRSLSVEAVKEEVLLENALARAAAEIDFDRSQH